MEDTENLIRGIQKGLLKWYRFKRNSKVLYIGDESDALAELIFEENLILVSVNCEQLYEKSWQQSWLSLFDYIVCIEKLEQEAVLENLLEIFHILLKPSGTLLLGMNNRIGLRYFCGDRDPYTGRNFDGVENYRRAYMREEDDFRGRTYAKQEIEAMLESSHFIHHKFYSVLTDLNNPSLIYAEDYLPNEDLSNRIFPTYNYPDTVFLEEETLYGTLIANGMFHAMANAYLIECPLNGKFSDVLHVTSSMERGPKNALLTVIRENGSVEKHAVSETGKERLKQLVKHNEDLKQHGIAVVDAEIKDGIYVMPYMDAETGQLYLKRLLYTDRQRFLNEMDKFRDLILQSSEIAESDGENGIILQKGYLDMVPLNSFYIDGKFVFYDQEFCEEYYPADAIIMRIIATFYSGNAEFRKIMPETVLFERYGLNKNRENLQRMEWDFLVKLRNEEPLRIYHERLRRNVEIINVNRQRMNYSENEYQRIFTDIFKNINGRKLILFGSGRFAQRFIVMYGRYYPITAVVDNSEGRWGQEVEGILIQSPKMLKDLQKDNYKVIVCIKNYLSVIKQLEEMGIKNYAVYDSGKSYAISRPAAASDPERKNSEQKKYHIGYVAGVFDMFHVGHVNILRRAKEQCDYLIVGVVPDELAYRQKNKYPVIPCDDRVEVLKSCRYTDLVEALPVDYGGIRDAYKLFQFDCMFSGDDHGDNIGWQADQEFLRRNGADIVFFPYTEKVSSTKLKVQLEQRQEEKEEEKKDADFMFTQGNL